jgi:hypothetical protein
MLYDSSRRIRILRIWPLSGETTQSYYPPREYIAGINYKF